MDTRDQVLELIDDGWLTEHEVLMACLKYMSVDEVKDMLEVNEYSDLWTRYQEWISDE
jgi:hypothetical protein